MGRKKATDTGAAGPKPKQKIGVDCWPSDTQPGRELDTSRVHVPESGGNYQYHRTMNKLSRCAPAMHLAADASPFQPSGVCGALSTVTSLLLYPLVDIWWTVSYDGPPLRRHEGYPGWFSEVCPLAVNVGRRTLAARCRVRGGPERLFTFTLAEAMDANPRLGECRIDSLCLVVEEQLESLGQLTVAELLHDASLREPLERFAAAFGRMGGGGGGAGGAGSGGAGAAVPGGRAGGAAASGGAGTSTPSSSGGGAPCSGGAGAADAGTVASGSAKAAASDNDDAGTPSSSGGGAPGSGGAGAVGAGAVAPGSAKAAASDRNPSASSGGGASDSAKAAASGSTGAAASGSTGAGASSGGGGVPAGVGTAARGAAAGHAGDGGDTETGATEGSGGGRARAPKSSDSRRARWAAALEQKARDKHS